jgi:hypothetical protein
MPSDDGLRLEDFHRLQHLRSQAIEPRRHQAIDVSDGVPLGRTTPQHIELMPKGEKFGLQRRARSQQPGHCVPDQLASGYWAKLLGVTALPQIATLLHKAGRTSVDSMTWVLWSFCIRCRTAGTPCRSKARTWLRPS